MTESTIEPPISTGGVEGAVVLRTAKGWGNSAKSAGGSPREVSRKLRDADIVLALGLAAGTVAFLALALGIAESGAARALASFVFLGSVGLAVAAAMVSRLVVWSAYLNERVMVLEKDSEALDMIHADRELRERLKEQATRKEIWARVQLRGRSEAAPSPDEWTCMESIDAVGDYMDRSEEYVEEELEYAALG